MRFGEIWQDSVTYGEIWPDMVRFSNIYIYIRFGENLRFD